MIQTHNVIAEFVHELNERNGNIFEIDAIKASGTAFYCKADMGFKVYSNIKFSLVIAPMMGIADPDIMGLVISTNSTPYHDSCFRLSDPDLLSKVEHRILQWVDKPFLQDYGDQWDFGDPL